MEPYLYVILGGRQTLSGFRRAHAFDLPHHEHQTVRLWEHINCGSQKSAQFRNRSLMLGILCVGGGCCLGFYFVQALESLLAPSMERLVYSNPRITARPRTSPSRRSQRLMSIFLPSTIRPDLPQ